MYNSFILFHSQKVSRDIFEELSTEYTLSQDQLFELIGYSCAVAVAKVCLYLSSEMHANSEHYTRLYV